MAVSEPGVFTSAGVDSPPLHILANTVTEGNGMMAYGAPGTFPANSANGTNFWVDVVFVTILPAGTPIPATTPVSSSTPSPEPSGVPTDAPSPVPSAVPTNTPPTISVSASTLVVNEQSSGTPATMVGTVSDPNGDAINLMASVGAVVNNGDGTWVWSWLPTDGPSQSQPVTITADDGHGSASQVSFSLQVNNVPPTAVFSANPVSIGLTESTQLIFTGASDVSPVDMAAGLAYSFDCNNDGNFEVLNSPEPQFVCSYATADTYMVLGRIADKDGAATDYTATVVVTAPLTGG
jgi:hypothetical protein